MKPPMPFLNAPDVSGQPDRPEYKGDQPDSGFSDFAADTDFLHKVHDPNFPHNGAGTHVPMWLTPKLAHDVLMKHGESGHAMPHPDIKIFKHLK